MELHSCLTQVWILEGLHSPVTAPCFLQSYTVLLPRPHLLKLVDLADEEIPVASSDLCVCNMDHVLGKEQDEIRKRTMLLAGRQQELPNIKINLRGFTPAMIQHHTYLTCASPTAPIQFSLGCLPSYLCLGWVPHSCCICFPHSYTLVLYSLQQFDSSNPSSCFPLFSHAICHNSQAETWHETLQEEVCYKDQEHRVI